MLGPAIQAAVTFVGCSEEYPQGELRSHQFTILVCTISPLHHPCRLDMYTIPGWLGVVAGLVSFLLFLPGVFQVAHPAPHLIT